MKLLDQFFESQRKVCKIFNYGEDWVPYSFDDLTDRFWKIQGDLLLFADKKNDLGDEWVRNEYTIATPKEWESIDKKWVMIRCSPAILSCEVLVILDASKKV